MRLEIKTASWLGEDNNANEADWISGHFPHRATIWVRCVYDSGRYGLYAVEETEGECTPPIFLFLFWKREETNILLIEQHFLTMYTVFLQIEPLTKEYMVATSLLSAQVHLQKFPTSERLANWMYQFTSSEWNFLICLSLCGHFYQSNASCYHKNQIVTSRD